MSPLFDRTFRVVAGWRDQRLRTIELSLVFGFCLLNWLIPLLRPELFPFSRFWLFADAPQRFALYKVLSPDGIPISTTSFQLQLNYDGAYPHKSYGREPPPTVNIFGTIQSEQFIREHVARVMAANSPHKFVDVEQRVVGAISSSEVGVIQTNVWRVVNSQHHDDL